MVCPRRNLTLTEKDNLPTPLLPPPDVQFVFVYPEELKPASGPPQGWSEAGGAGCMDSPLTLTDGCHTMPACFPPVHTAYGVCSCAKPVYGLRQFQWQLSLLT